MMAGGICNYVAERQAEELAKTIAKLPPYAQEAFLQQIKGAVSLVEMMQEQKTA